MRWVIKCSLRHYEWWDALKLTGYYLPVIRFCHGLNYFKAAYLHNHAICCRVCVVCVRLPPLSQCPSTLPSLTAFRQLFILRMNGKWRQKAAVKVEAGDRHTAQIKSHQVIQRKRAPPYSHYTCANRQRRSLSCIYPAPTLCPHL